MRPIVNGLEDEYGDRVDFLELDALDGDQGEAAFERYSLRGHPSIIVTESGGEISSMLVGVVSREEVEQAIENALGAGP